jgi:hypothetical protein
MATYRIHPGIGIARLGNSPDAFCISPEEPAALPLDCDARGNPLMSPDGKRELRVRMFKDEDGRIKRQAARFQIYVYDDDSPEGRPLKIGDPIQGGGNDGILTDIQWRVYLANKKSEWYEFLQLDGEKGYSSAHPRRNADVVPDGRQRLIIDPGPRTVNVSDHRRAHLDRFGGDDYAPTFPPPLKPNSIETLGDIMTDDSGRLLVLGGHGNSGSYLFDEFGQPRIDEYANNDGWFDDTSDGPVMARLVMYSPTVDATRFIDVEYPAWCVVGYPLYVPQILDVVTMEDVVENLAITEFASRTELYGTAGTFDNPPRIPPTDEKALTLWRAGRLRWNPEHKPWFYRDIWPILFRPNEFGYLCSILGMSNFPHDQSTRGTFDPYKLGVPPTVDWDAVSRCAMGCMRRHHSGELFVETLNPALLVLEKPAQNVLRKVPAHKGRALSAAPADDFSTAIQKAISTFAKAAYGDEPGDDYTAYLTRWRNGSGKPEHQVAKDELEHQINEILQRFFAQLTPELCARLTGLTHEHLRKFHAGSLLEECRLKCIASNTYDPFRAYRTFLFDLLRKPGEENQFAVGDKPSSRVFNLPLMPLLCGDNPLTNDLPSKFLRLTDYQYFLLRQWSLGYFYNEELEGWDKPDPWDPYKDWVNRNGRDLDRGVLSNLLGGAFCPGGETTWIIRNPSIYREPYRIKADPSFYSFAQTAAQANANKGQNPEFTYASYAGADLSTVNNFDVGLQPGDLTKYGACPWQADFNECSTQTINITYDEFNKIYPESDGNSQMRREERVWDTLWWPAHRPLQTWEITSVTNGKPNYIWIDWTPGVPQTNAGDLKMVTEWWRLSFVVRNPYQPSAKPPELPPDQKYISVERTRRTTKSVRRIEEEK